VAAAGLARQFGMVCCDQALSIGRIRSAYRLRLFSSPSLETVQSPAGKVEHDCSLAVCLNSRGDDLFFPSCRGACGRRVTMNPSRRILGLVVLAIVAGLTVYLYAGSTAPAD
jgi:hypothetical protein